jgi:Flp pilus assembly protein TadD
LLGQARLKLGRFAEAREPLERAAKFLPKDPAAQVNLAGCLTVLGDHVLALAALERAARLKPGDAVIAHNRGRALQALGRDEDAERAYDEALAVDHRLLPSLAARAGLPAQRGDWMGALADLDMALVSRPGVRAC